MQIMPATAQEMGVSVQQLYEPAVNIHTAARYLKQLNRTFADIKDKRERIKFVLAAYNGGALHIKDAMALAGKYGGNAHLWADVSGYVLKLSEPEYYRDPVVSNGYMRGSETEAYVRQILDRWFQYQGCARAYSKGSTPKPAKRNMKDGKHQSNVKSAEEFVGS
jgi:membrane-bound lytic murein transglycosylase F